MQPLSIEIGNLPTINDKSGDDKLILENNNNNNNKNTSRLRLGISKEKLTRIEQDEEKDEKEVFKRQRSGGPASNSAYKWGMKIPLSAGPSTKRSRSRPATPSTMMFSATPVRKAVRAYNCQMRDFVVGRIAQQFGYGDIRKFCEDLQIDRAARQQGGIVERLGVAGIDADSLVDVLSRGPDGLGGIRPQTFAGKSTIAEIRGLSGLSCVDVPNNAPRLEKLFSVLGANVLAIQKQYGDDSDEFVQQVEFAAQLISEMHESGDGNIYKDQPRCKTVRQSVAHGGMNGCNNSAYLARNILSHVLLPQDKDGNLLSAVEKGGLVNTLAGLTHMLFAYATRNLQTSRAPVPHSGNCKDNVSRGFTKVAPSIALLFAAGLMLIEGYKDDAASDTTDKLLEGIAIVMLAAIADFSVKMCGAGSLTKQMRADADKKPLPLLKSYKDRAMADQSLCLKLLKTISFAISTGGGGAVYPIAKQYFADQLGSDVRGHGAGVFAFIMTQLGGSELITGIGKALWDRMHLSDQPLIANSKVGVYANELDMDLELDDLDANESSDFGLSIDPAIVSENLGDNVLNLLEPPGPVPAQRPEKVKLERVATNSTQHNSVSDEEYEYEYEDEYEEEDEEEYQEKRAIFRQDRLDTLPEDGSDTTSDTAAASGGAKYPASGPGAAIR